MKHDEFMNEIKHMFGVARADAYKTGFTDGMKFVTEPSENLINATEKAISHVLDQVYDLHGKGKEYNIVKQCLDAVLYDLKAAAHLEKPKPLSGYWDDEYGDDL